MLDEIYTEGANFYRQYVDLLLAEGQADRSRDVIEDELEEFSRSPDVDRLAADFYRRSRPSASGLDPEGEGRKLG